MALSAEECPIVLLIDINCFYAQVEAVKHPYLENSPIGVFQKSLIVTANYPARARGVKKGCSISEALSQCPDVILRNGENLEKYRQASDAFLSTLYDALSEASVPCSCQKVGLDEVFIDVTTLVDEGLDALWNISREVSQPPKGDTITIEGQDCHGDLGDSAASGRTLLDPYLAEDIRRSLSCGRPIPFAGGVVTLPNKEHASSARHHLDDSFCIEANYIFEQERTQKSRTPGKWNSSLRLACASHICQALRDRLKTKLKLTTSAGIGCSKVVAKCAASYCKEPDVQLTSLPEATPVFLKAFPLARIPGIGKATLMALDCGKWVVQPCGQNWVNNPVYIPLVTTVENVQQAAVTFLRQLLGGNETVARRIYLACQGLDGIVNPVINSGSPKSISVEDSFSQTGGILFVTQLESVIRRLVVPLVKRQQQHQKRYNEVPRTLRLSLRYRGEGHRRLARQRPIAQTLFCKMLNTHKRTSLVPTNEVLSQIQSNIVQECLALLSSHDFIPKQEESKQLLIPVHVVNIAFLNFQKLEAGITTLNHLYRKVTIERISPERAGASEGPLEKRSVTRPHLLVRLQRRRNFSTDVLLHFERHPDLADNLN